MNFKHFQTLTLTIALMGSIMPLGYSEASAVDSDATIQNEILVQVNLYRQHKGLPPLTMDNNIIREAKQHSSDMANHKMGFGHQYFTNRIARLHADIKNSSAGAENVAYNYKDAQDVVKNWIKSSGHRVNIEGNYNLTGIGIARDQKGKIYFTQIFLRTGNGATVRRNLFNPFHIS